jgi:uncharacterized protein (TIGR02271 family)
VSFSNQARLLQRAAGLKSADHFRGKGTIMAQEEKLELAREELDVAKREIETGRVRVTKVVREQEKLVDEALRHHEAEIQRVPVDRVVAEPVEPRYEGDTLVVPVLEEVMVKQWRIKEEIRIRRKAVDTPHQQRVSLKTEELVIEREEAQPNPPSPMQPSQRERS